MILKDTPPLTKRLSDYLSIPCSSLITINTNGTLYDAEIADMLSRNKEHIDLIVSYDGLFHDKYRVDKRQKGSASRVIRNIKKFLDLGVKLSVTCCVVPEHIPYLCETLDLIGRNFCKEIPVNLSFIRGGLKRLKPFNRYPGYLENEYTEELLEKAALSVVELIEQGYNIFYERFSRKLCEGGYCYHCGAYLYECCIMPNGDVYPCHNFIDQDYLLGNVKDDNFQIKPEGRIYERFISRKVNLLEPCKECIFQNVCLSSFDCPSHSEYDLGNFYLVDKKMCKFAQTVELQLLKKFILNL